VKTSPKKITIKELKKFWDGPKADFNEKLYQEYLDRKKNWIKNMN